MPQNLRLATILLAGLAASSFAAMQLTMTANGWTRSWGGVVQGSDYSYILVGNEAIGNAGYENQGIFKFSLDGLTADVTAAALHLWVDGQQYAPNPATLSRIPAGNGSVVQFTDSYSGALSAAVPAFNYENSGGWVSVDVASLVNAARANGDGYVAFRLTETPYVTDGSHNQLYLINSSGAGANQPYLDYTIPEPAALGLLALGGLPMLRRRRRPDPEESVRPV